MMGRLYQIGDFFVRDRMFESSNRTKKPPPKKTQMAASTPSSETDQTRHMSRKRRKMQSMTPRTSLTSQVTTAPCRALVNGAASSSMPSHLTGPRALFCRPGCSGTGRPRRMRSLRSLRPRRPRTLGWSRAAMASSLARESGNQEPSDRGEDDPCGVLEEERKGVRRRIEA